MLRTAPIKNQIKAEEFSNNYINEKKKKCKGRKSAEFLLLSVPQISGENKPTGILAYVLFLLATSFCCPVIALHV